MIETNLTEKVAVITGGSEGIGKAIAIKLAEEGCRVAICARRPDVLNDAAEEIGKQAGAKILAIPADVTVEQDIHRFLETVIAEYGDVDILINNAGRSAVHYFEDATEEIWQEDFDLKFWSAVRCSRIVVPGMKKKRNGCIINITHPGGKAPGAQSMPTSVSRAAGIAFTKALSHDMAPHNIRVNTVCLTNIISAQGMRAWKAINSPLSYEDWCVEQGKNVPLGRLGEANEVADLVTFLVSDRGTFITGASINIDGGTSATV